MTEWNGSSYVASPRKLASALEASISSIDGSGQTLTWQSLSSSAVTILSGRASNCVLTLVCNHTDVGFKYRQAFSWSDRRVSANSYRALVTISASQGW
jgi:hypothetical protein